MCVRPPAICILDTGIAGAHPLVAPALAGAWAFDERWGTDDHEPHGGHGTAMAGLVLYGDLEGAANDQRPLELSHAVESDEVRARPRGFDATQPTRYGFVTQGAVALAEVERPNAARSFCIATSSPDFFPGHLAGAERSTSCVQARCPVSARISSPRQIQAGSLHCDLWRGAAVDLASHDEIAVYPVGGWWKSHTGQQRMNDKGRYALILSIEAPGQAVDLHSRIAAMVEVKQAEIQAALVYAAGQ